MTASFSEALERDLLVGDAAHGTRLLARGLDLGRDDPALWNWTHPEMIAELHRRDVAAGADVVLANTFGANRLWLDRFGRGEQVEPINRRAVALARAASRFVVGSIGPTAGASAVEQAAVLADAGADALWFETHRLDEAEVALRAVAGTGPLPLLVSLFDWPDPPGPAARRLIDLGAFAVGANCVPVAAAIRLAAALAGTIDRPLLFKPSAGGPAEAFESPAAWERAVPRLAAHGAGLIGGCCGTTEVHIAALRAAVDQLTTAGLAP